jgi:hypothetical protein
VADSNYPDFGWNINMLAHAAMLGHLDMFIPEALKTLKPSENEKLSKCLNKC